MKSRYEILMVMLVTGIPQLLWYQAQAQQAEVDAGVDYAKGLVDSVKNITSATSVNTIPGYGGTNIPETSYYSNQDLGNMQTDAVIGVTTGIANEASQYAYDQATQPKLQFAPTDPIFVNSTSISTGAMANPDVLTVPTGSCAVADVTGTETRTETCTAWMTPITQTCNNTLNVDVTWEDISSCPIATSFSQVQTVINYRDRDDYVYARAYCSPTGDDTTVRVQIDASDGDPGDCTGWTDVTVSTDQASTIFTGKILRPRFSSFCTYVPVFISGACVDNNCDYTLSYYQLNTWRWSDGDQECTGTSVDLASMGLDGSLFANSYTQFRWNGTGNFCVYKSASLNLTFEQPHITRTPTVTETWNDGCGHLEAQVQ
jgi:hypothetical protein